MKSVYVKLCKRLHSKLFRRSFCNSKKLKVLFRGHILLMILIAKKFLERFTKKNCKRKTNQKWFRAEKNKENYMLNGKFIIIRLIAG